MQTDLFLNYFIVQKLKKFQIEKKYCMQQFKTNYGREHLLNVNTFTKISGDSTRSVRKVRNALLIKLHLRS